MKTNPINMNKMFRLAGMAIAVVLVAGATSIVAQTARGGATALVKPTAPAVAPVSTATYAKAMNCKMCIDKSVTIADVEPRGLGARTLLSGGTPVKVITTHGCSACGTDWNVAGVGRAKQATPTHKCGSCG